MGQVESQGVKPEGDCDSSLAKLQAVFLAERSKSDDAEPWNHPEPPLEVLEQGEWVPASCLPTSFAPSHKDDGHATLHVLQREEHGLWSDLGPAESFHILNAGNDRVVYRRCQVPYEADMRKMTWKSGHRGGRLRVKPHALGCLSSWLRRQLPAPPQEEAQTLAIWCSDRMTSHAQDCAGALLQHHQHRQAAASAEVEQMKEDQSGPGDAEDMDDGGSSLAGCAYAGALARLAVEPALAGSGAGLVLQILEAQLSSVKPLAIFSQSGGSVSPAFTTAMGFSEAFRCSLAGDTLAPPVARRLAALLLRVGLQAGLSGPVLAAITWLLRSKDEAAKAEDEFRPLVEAIHNVNGVHELQVSRTRKQDQAGRNSLERRQARRGPADWPRGPALLYSPVHFPGVEAAQGLGPAGVRFSVRLEGNSEQTCVGLCAMDTLISSAQDFENSTGLLVIGKQKAFTRADRSAGSWTDFGPRALQDGDEVLLVLRENELKVEVSGEDWGTLPNIPAFWTSGARVVVVLQSSEALADINISPKLAENTDSGTASTTWAAAAGQSDFDTAWQQAAGEEEGRIASVLLQCIGRNAHYYVSNEASRVKPMPVVEESAHEYASDMNEWKRVEIPGAVRLKVEFDRRCETEQGRDVLTFYKDRNSSTKLPGTEPMSGTAFRNFEVSGSGFWYNFTTDGSDERWGYKFTVTPTKIMSPSPVPLAAENAGSGAAESLETLLLLVSERRAFGESSLKSIFKAAGAQLRYLGQQSDNQATKAIVRSLLRALLKAAEASYPSLEPANLVEQLAVEALQVAGPRVAGDCLSRLELMAAVLENGCCPPTLSSALNRLLAGDEYYGELLLEPGAARSLLERLVDVALGQDSSLPPANRDQAVHTLLQVMGDIISALATSETSGGSDKWGLVQRFAERILLGASERLGLAAKEQEAYKELLGVLAPAMLRGLALALPGAPQEFLVPLLPKLQGLITAGEQQAPSPIITELLEGALALQHSFSLSLLRSGNTKRSAAAAAAQDARLAEASRCQVIRAVPQVLLAEVTNGTRASPTAQFVGRVESQMGLSSRPASPAPPPAEAFEEFVSAESTASQAVLKRLDTAAGGVMFLPSNVRKIKRLAFVLLLRHYNLEDELAGMLAVGAEATPSPKQSAPRALSLLWRQAHVLSQQVMASCQQAGPEAQAMRDDAESHLRFALRCASAAQKFDIDFEEAAAAAQEEAEEALEVRQRMTRGGSEDFSAHGPPLARVGTELSDGGKGTIAMPPALSRWVSAPPTTTGSEDKSPSFWARLKNRVTTVRTLQLSLKPLHAIIAAEGDRSQEARPVDQLKQLLAVPLKTLVSQVQVQSDTARCIAASLHLLSAAVRPACSLSASAAAETLLALRTAWQLSATAAKSATEATALASLQSARAKALVAVFTAVQEPPTALSPQDQAQVQTMALCCLCGELGAAELQAMDRQANGLLAGAQSWAHGNEGGVLMPVRCAAWLCNRARIAAACVLPPDEREAALSRLYNELMTARPSVDAPVKEQSGPPSLLRAFAPMGGMSSQAVRKQATGWQPGPNYSVEGPGKCLLRTTGPQLTENDEVDLQSLTQQLVVCGSSMNEGRHYWEISIEDAPEEVFSINIVGVAGPGAPKEFTSFFIRNSWGIIPLEGGSAVHGRENPGAGDDSSDNSSILSSDSFAFPAFNKGLVIGVLLDCDNGTLTFFADGECKGQAFGDLEGKGPFTPCVSTGGGGFVFKLNLSPTVLPSEAEGAMVAPPMMEPTSPSPDPGQSNFGGIGVCIEQPTLAWLLSVGWVLAALGTDTSAQHALGGSTHTALTGALLPSLLAEKAEPLTKVLSAVLLEGLPPPTQRGPVDELLASMAADAPGWVRSAKANALRHWCAGSATGGGVTWAALTDACKKGGELRSATLEVMAEAAQLRCLFPVRLEGGVGGTELGTVLDISAGRVAVLPNDSTTVCWCDPAAVWAEPRRCKPPFPASFVEVMVSSTKAALKGSKAPLRQNIREFCALLSILEDAKVAQASQQLLCEIAPLALQEVPDPQLGNAWSAVPRERRLALCTALLARPSPAGALAAAVKASGKSAAEHFLATTDAQTLVSTGGGLWRRPGSAKERLLGQASFKHLVMALVEGLSLAEADELWLTAHTQEVHQIQALSSNATWRVLASNSNDEPGEEAEPEDGDSWEEKDLDSEIGKRLDTALSEMRPNLTLTLDSDEEFKFDIAAMSLVPCAGGSPRQLKRMAPAEFAINLSQFETLVNAASQEQVPAAQRVQRQPSSQEVLNSEAFTSVLTAFGLPGAEQPRSREGMLRLLAAIPRSSSGTLRRLLPPPTREGKRGAAGTGSMDLEKDESTDKALATLRQRTIGTAPATASDSVAQWAENQLARLVCAKILSSCQAIEAQALGQAAEVVQLLLTIRPLADLRRFQEHSEALLSQDRGLSAAFQQAAAAEFLGVLRGCLRPSEPIVVEETIHPYANNMNDWKEVRIPGAQALQVRFDPRCSTESGCDNVRFTDEKDGGMLPEAESEMSGTTFTDFKTERESFWYRFYSDGSNVDWGVRFTVSAVPPLLPKTGYWDSESTAPNTADALWLLKVALAGGPTTSSTAKLFDLRTDVLVPVLLALVQKLTAEEARIQVLGALSDLLEATRHEPGNLWYESYFHLKAYVAATQISLASPVGQSIMALLVQLSVLFPKEASVLCFGPSTGALVHPSCSRAILTSDAGVVSMGTSVKAGERVTIPLELSKGLQVGVVPASSDLSNITGLIALEATSGNPVGGGKNCWAEDSAGCQKGAATLSGENNEILASTRMEGTNYVVRAKYPYRHGTHYWEITCTKRDGGGNGYHIIGVALEDHLESFSDHNCGDKIWGLHLDGANAVHDGNKISLSGSVNHENQSVYGIFLDIDAGELSFYSNGANVGGGAVYKDLPDGPWYPIICVGCLESNSYKVDFNPEEPPTDVQEKLQAAGVDSDSGLYQFSCDMHDGSGSITLADPAGKRETKPLPETGAPWRIVVTGAPGLDLAMGDGGEVSLEAAVAKAEVAMEAVSKGSTEAVIPEFAIEAFVAWHRAHLKMEESQEPEIKVDQPWTMLGPDQLLVTGAGCEEVNGLYNKISTDPDTYMSEHEATIMNDRDGHWVISASFNIELWVYEAPTKEGPWTANGSRGRTPLPTVCGQGGPPQPSARSKSKPARPASSQALSAGGIPGLLRELRRSTITVPPGSGKKLEVPGAQRLAVSLESGKGVEVIRVDTSGKESAVELWPGDKAEVDANVVELRSLVGSTGLRWSGTDGDNQGVFSKQGAGAGISARGHLTRGPLQFICDSAPSKGFTSHTVELAVKNVMCPQEHQIVKRDAGYGWTCDGCRSSNADNRFRCTEGCNFDYCGVCMVQKMTGMKVGVCAVPSFCRPCVGETVKAEYTYKLGAKGLPERRTATVEEVREDGSITVSWDGTVYQPDTRDKLPLQVDPAEGGGTEEECWAVESVTADDPANSAVARWNAEHPDQALTKRSRITAAQGRSGNKEEILEAMCEGTENNPLKLTISLPAPPSLRATVPATPVVSGSGLFQAWTDEETSVKFATSPEVKVCSLSGDIEIGLCTDYQNTDLLKIASLAAGTVASGDTLRLLLAKSSEGKLLAVLILLNGRLLESWKPGDDVNSRWSPAMSKLRLWVLCYQQDAGKPRRQGNATLKLCPFSSVGPQAKLAAELSDFGGVSSQKWNSFAAWWPETEATTVVAWPVGQTDQTRLLAELADEVKTFCAGVLKGWHMEADMELIQVVETMAKDAGKKLLFGPRLHFESKSKKWALSGHNASEGYGRYLILCTLNEMISRDVLPVVDLGKLRATRHGRALHSLKRLLFAEIRGTSVRPNGGAGGQVKLELKRPLATACREAGECDTLGKLMLFAQASSAVSDPSVFRRSGQNWEEQPFSVSYEDEPGVDQGGLYRDFLDAITEELMSKQLPLLLPTANQSTNAGENRDAWILNPALKAAPGSPGERMLVFLGRLMGLCLLRGDIIPVSMPSSFWKGLQGDDVDLEDLEAIDVAAANSVRMLREPALLGIDADSFSSTFPDLRFSIEDSAGQRRELMEGGAGQPVMFEDAPEYADRMLSVRLQESEKQLDVLRRGLREVALMSSWALWPWQTLQERVCGVATIDPELLRKHTNYEGYESSSPVVKRFWDALNSFSQDELKSFLHFTWGRSRLPPDASEKWGPGFKLSKAARSDMLPLAHTCFFQLELPEYETDDIMRDRLRFAIQNCISMQMA